MNSDTMEIAEQCAKDAGAIVPCATCGNSDVSAGDAEAESGAYARATNEWKAGGRGFRSMSREEVMGVVKLVLQDANIECPSCRA